MRPLSPHSKLRALHNCSFSSPSLNRWGDGKDDAIFDFGDKLRPRWRLSILTAGVGNMGDRSDQNVGNVVRVIEDLSMHRLRGVGTEDNSSIGTRKRGGNGPRPASSQLKSGSQIYGY